MTVIALLATVPIWSQSEAPVERAPEKTASQSAPAVPDSTKLEIEKAVKANYPDEAQQKEIQGEVVIKLDVNEQGDVTNAEVVSGDPILAKSALAAAKKWKFKPFIRNGKPSPVSTKIPFDFYFSGNAHEVRAPEPAAPTIIADTNTPENPGNVSDQEQNKPLRVRVSQGVLQGALIHQVQPIYPSEARRDHIQGTVVIKALIGKDGHIKDLQVLSGPKELVAAATGAVEQWRYRPWVIKGDVVEVETVITANFNLRY